MFVSKTTGSQNLNLVRDPFFSNTVLLLHGDGTSGANNSVFLDSSSFNNSITTTGSPIQGTDASPFSTVSRSVFFDGGTANVIQIQLISDVNSNSYGGLSFGAGSTTDTNGDFTIETWIYPTSSAAVNKMIFNHHASVNINAYRFYINSSNRLQWNINDQGSGDNANLAITVNKWSHVAWVRSRTTCFVYIDGILKNTTTGVTNSADGTLTNPYIGNQNGQLATFIGYISNLRISKRLARYKDGDFIPPTRPFPIGGEETSFNKDLDIPGMSLLACHANRHVDESNFRLIQGGTREGTHTLIPGSSGVVTDDPPITKFTPFTPYRIYSNTIFGGGVSFNGTSDSLAVSASNNFYFSTENFAIEAWIYPKSLTANQAIVSTLASSHGSYIPGQFMFYINSTGRFTFYVTVSSTAVTSVGSTSGVISVNSWNHIAVTKSLSGSTGTLTFYLNGVDQGGSSSILLGGYTYGSNTVGPAIGYRKDANTSINYFNGYISDLEIRKYVGSYTPSVPTLPKTPVANTESNGGGTTQFLLKGTNAGIIDSTQKNNLITVGAAQLSSTVSKFGLTSMFFNGTTDYLSSPTNTSFDQNVIFTVEFWAYKTGAGTGNGYLYAQNTSGFLTILFNATNNVLVDKSGVGVQITSSSTFASNAWHHIAMAYDGTNTRLFVNGVLQGTMSGGGAASATTLTIGAYLSGSNFFQGYIDELRVTRGVARYTSNFTPRTGRFPDR